MVKISEDWIINKKILKQSGKQKLEPNEMSCGIKLRKNGKPVIIIRLGKDLCSTLVWDHKDAVVLYYNKNDQSKVMLGKTESKDGYAVNRAKGVDAATIKITWNGDMPLNPCNAIKTKYRLTHRNTHLEFTLPV